MKTNTLSKRIIELQQQSIKIQQHSLEKQAERLEKKHTMNSQQWTNAKQRLLAPKRKEVLFSLFMNLLILLCCLPFLHESWIFSILLLDLLSFVINLILYRKGH